MNGLLGYDELRGREKMIFDNVMTCWFGVAESALLSQDLDIVGDEDTCFVPGSFPIPGFIRGGPKQRGFIHLKSSIGSNMKWPKQI
jgi:hypothetical protein